MPYMTNPPLSSTGTLSPEKYPGVYRRSPAGAVAIIGYPERRLPLVIQHDVGFNVEGVSGSVACSAAIGLRVPSGESKTRLS